MKKIIFKSFSIFLAILMFHIQTFAYSSKSKTSITKSEIQSVISFDDSEIYAAFADISNLDQYLAQNNNKTYTDVSQENSTLLNGTSSVTTLPFSTTPDELALGIPSFLWGCIFGITGVIVVYIMTDKNKEQTKKAVTGCVVTFVAAIVIYAVVIGFTVAAVSNMPAESY